MFLHAMPRTRLVLQSGIESGLHPGVQIYVSLDGHVVVDDAIGIARPGVTMTRDTLTLWMSAGKPIAAVAIMQLVDRGLLSLDTRIVDILPEFGINGKEQITLRHILTHTAGFRGPLNNFTPGTWEAILQRVYALKQEPGWIPGEKAGYHIGSSWFVLGEIVRRLDGRPIDRYVREAIFARVEEADASIGVDDSDFDRRENDLSLMYVTEKEPTTDWPGNTREANTLPRPGANARGPIRALGRVYESLSMDERLLSRRLAGSISNRHRAGILDHTFKQTLDWGLGVMIDSKRYAGEHAYGFGPHASPDTFGHSGNQSSCGFCDPLHKLVVAWTCNGMPGEAKHQSRASSINQAIYQDLGLAPLSDA